MEQGELNKENIVKRVARRVVGKFSRIVPESSPAQPSQPATKPADTEAVNRILLAAEKLLQRNPASRIPNEVAFTERGVEASFIHDILRSQEGLSLEDASVGDVVWWKDAAEEIGYYLVTEPYTHETVTSENDLLHKPGKGVIKIMTEKGEIVSADTVISGASFGGSLRLHTIAKNVPLELVAGPDQQDPNSPFPWSRHFTTPEIVDMGIIKAGSLQNDKN